MTVDELQAHLEHINELFWFCRRDATTLNWCLRNGLPVVSRN